MRHMKRLRENGSAGAVLLLGLVLSSAVIAPSVMAGPFLDSCAAAASSQFEKGFESVGMDTREIDAGSAIPICTEALEQEPNSAQIKAWLGRAYFAADDTGNAVRLFEEAAEASNVVALAMLGDMLITGNGVPQDMARGARLLIEGAEAGFALAQNSLGVSYEYGEGVAQDYAAAARWYRAAAEQGMSKAQANIGFMYQEGLGGLPRDYVAAAAWYERSVVQGDPSGQVKLGKLLEEVLGQPADLARAAELYRLAAVQGEKYGQNNLGFLGSEQEQCQIVR
jgi:hypothetical protein